MSKLRFLRLTHRSSPALLPGTFNNGTQIYIENTDYVKRLKKNLCPSAKSVSKIRIDKKCPVVNRRLNFNYLRNLCYLWLTIFWPNK